MSYLIQMMEERDKRKAEAREKAEARQRAVGDVAATLVALMEEHGDDLFLDAFEAAGRQVASQRIHQRWAEDSAARKKAAGQARSTQSEEQRERMALTQRRQAALRKALAQPGADPEAAMRAVPEHVLRHEDNLREPPEGDPRRVKRLALMTEQEWQNVLDAASGSARAKKR